MYYAFAKFLLHMYRSNMMGEGQWESKKGKEYN